MRAAALAAISELSKSVGAKKTLAALKDSISHKNWRVREGVMLSINSLFFDQTKPAAAFKEPEALASAIPTAVAYLEDANKEVRELAVRFLEESYKLDRTVRVLVKNAGQTLKISAATVVLQKFDSYDSSSFEVDAESQSLVPDIKPVVVAEPDLKSQFQAIEKQLLLTDADWDKRVEGVQKLQALVLGGATKLKGFYPLLKALEEPLHSQLREARSTALKEACNLVSLLARALGSQFASIFDVYLAALLRSVCVTIQIISDSADYCIQNVLRHVPVTVNTLTQILQSAQTSKHNTIRIKCSGYLLQLVTDRNMSYIEKHVELVESTICKCIADPATQVRSTARLAYIAFARRWPERSPRIHATFESTVKSAIAKDEASPTTEQQLVDLAAAAASGAFKKATIVSAAPPITPKAQKSSASTAKLIGLGGPSRMVSSGSSGNLAAAHSAVPAGLQAPAAAVSSVPQPALVRPALIAPKLGLVSAAIPPSTTTAPTTPGVRNSAQRIALIAPITALAPSDSGYSGLGGASRVPVAALAGVKPVPATAVESSESALLKRPPMSAKKTVAAASALPAPALVVKPPVAGRTQLSSSAETPGSKRAPTSSSITIPRDGTVGLDEAQVFTMVMIQANHQDWAERAKAIAVLKDRLGAHDNAKQFQHHILSSDVRLDRLAQMLAQRLADPHFKVIQQCVDLVIDLLDLVPEATMDAWLNDRLLPPVLSLQKDEKSRALAHVVTSALIARARDQPASLFAWTMRAVELSDIKTKQGALKFLPTLYTHESFAPFFSNYYSTPASMQTTLKKLARYGKWESCNDLRQTMLDALASIAENFTQPFAAAFFGAGFANQDELLKKVRLRCPQLAQVAFDGRFDATAPSTTNDAAARRARLERTKSVGKAAQPKPVLPVSIETDAVAALELQDDLIGDINTVLTLPSVPAAQAPKTPLTPRRARSQHFTPAEARATEALQQQQELLRSAPRRQPLTPVPRKSASKAGNDFKQQGSLFLNAENILSGTPLEVLEFAAQQHRSEQKLELRQGLRRAEDIMHLLMNRENGYPQLAVTSPAPVKLVAPKQKPEDLSFSESLSSCQRLLPQLGTSLPVMQEFQQLIKVLPPSALERLIAELPEFFSSIEKAVATTDAQVRRIAVMSLVDLRMALGEVVDQKLQGLSDTSQRLVRLYMKQRASVALAQ